MAENSQLTTKYLSIYEHGVDEKRRLQIPAKWRPPTTEQFEFVLVRWQPPGQKVPCLLGLPPPAFERLFEKVSALPFADVNAETLRRSLTGDSEAVSLDSAGRICLPQRFAEQAGIKKKAVIIGMLDRFQVFSPENYEVVKADDEARKAEALKMI